MAANRVTNEDVYFPVDSFLYSIKKYDLLLDFSNIFFANVGKKYSSRVQFENLMNSNLFGEKLLFILEVLTYLAMHCAKFRKCNIVNYIICDQFYDNLVRHVYYLYENKSNLLIDHHKDLSILVKFYESIIYYLPMCDVIYQKMYVLFEMTFKCINIFGKCDLKVYESIKVLLGLIQDMANSLENNVYFYKDLEVFPNEVNLYEKRDLLPNIIIGPYDDSEKYLDIQYKLLREDFFQGIRDELEQLKQQRVGIQVKKKYDLYRGVRSKGFCPKSCNKYKLCHVIFFTRKDKEILRKFDWKTSKKFMNGSLLLFTRDNFTTFILGIVETNYCVISEGYRLELKVSIFGNPYNLKIGSDYDMLEPGSFFEPYHRSLKTLKAINPYHFPFAEDIITVTKTITPSLINPSDIPSLLKQSSDLNSSQLHALAACLSQRFTLIQGPPGTGKSYLSRKLIKLLAENTDDNRPILVVCMRNRSLDIILEPLAKAGLKILRFGMTENELLEKFTYFNYKKRNWQMHLLRSKESFKFLKQNIGSFRKIINNSENYNKPEKIEEVYQLHNKAGEAMKYHMDYFDAFRILSKDIQVIGATTTGAAKHYRLLSHVKPKAVIIEEAAEILESFVTTSLPSSSDHLILIGDHMQLQPISRLPGELNMEISLFERMIMNGKSYNRLTVQHRMRPEIAELISPLIYDDLTNHQSVNNFPDVVGVSKNVFFLTHTSREQFKDDCLSYINTFEGDLVLSFANYLVKEGYNPTDISILAAYSAQQQYLITKSDNFPYLRGMPIQTIDNYQGDENNIILLSLVRSKGETIGFLYKTNRVNVALSRAKHGLYLFGNMDTLSKFPNIWRKVDIILKKRKCIGRSIPLLCKSHKNITNVSTPEDLKKLEYGGCLSVCNSKKECGHKCTLPCHPNLDLHKSFLCQKPCLRKPCGLHICNKKCFESCGICRKPRIFVLKCGHNATLQCSANPDDHLCNQLCNRKSSCGLHQCEKRCHQKCGPCKIKRNFFLKCGHQVSLPCSSDVDSYKCTQKCKRKSCPQHNCDKLCHENCQPCEKLLKYTLKCGHSATIKCTDNLKSYKCPQQCQKILSCGIHKCKNRCFEKCEPNCTQVVLSVLQCGHVSPKICSWNIKKTVCPLGCEALMRPCGIHKCRSKNCFLKCEELCYEETSAKLQCGHSVTKKCYMNLKRIKCRKVCGLLKKCGLHFCLEVCHYPYPCPPCDEEKWNTCKYCFNRFTSPCDEPSSAVCTLPLYVKFKECPHYYTERCDIVNHPTYENLRKHRCNECNNKWCSVS